MKRIVFIIPLLVLMLAGCGSSRQEKVISTYNNGQTAKVYCYDKAGQWVAEKDYYEAGELMMEGPIANGQRNGDWTAYFPDGRVQSRGVFRDGDCNGKWQVYYENGHLWMEGAYKDDHRCGEWIFYDEQGYELERVNYGSCD